MQTDTDKYLKANKTGDCESIELITSLLRSRRLRPFDPGHICCRKKWGEINHNVKRQNDREMYFSDGVMI